jgi:hypothetical protein
MTFASVRAALALALAVPALAVAQSAAPPPGPLAKPSADPRDLTGVWQVNGYQMHIVGIDGPIPYQPATQAEYERRRKAQADGKPITDSTARCLPSGVPRIMAAPYPIKILQTPKEVVILHEVQHLMRFVYLNEEHPKDLDPTYMGHSVGHWEGDTLVVDTTALTPLTLIDEAGTPHSDVLHVIERFRKIDNGATLENILTVDDPKAFTKPWRARFLYRWRPEVRFLEYICEENNRNVTSSDGVVGVAASGAK